MWNINWQSTSQCLILDCSFWFFTSRSSLVLNLKLTISYIWRLSLEVVGEIMVVAEILFLLTLITGNNHPLERYWEEFNYSSIAQQDSIFNLIFPTTSSAYSSGSISNSQEVCDWLFQQLQRSISYSWYLFLWIHYSCFYLYILDIRFRYLLFINTPSLPPIIVINSFPSSIFGNDCTSKSLF